MRLCIHFLYYIYLFFCILCSFIISIFPWWTIFVLTLSKPNRQQIIFFYSVIMGCGASKTSKDSFDVVDLSPHKQPSRTTITVQEQRSDISATGDTASSVLSPPPKVEFVYRFTSYFSCCSLFMFYFLFLLIWYFNIHKSCWRCCAKIGLLHHLIMTIELYAWIH